MPRRPVTMNVGCHKEARRLGWATSSPTSTSAIFSIDSVSRPMPRSSSAHMCVTNGIEVKVPSMLGLMKPSPTYRLHELQMFFMLLLVPSIHMAY